MILDTQYLGALVDGDEAAREKAGELDSRDVPTRIPTAVLWEAYTGIANAPSSEGRTQLRSLLRASPDESFDGRPDARDGTSCWRTQWRAPKNVSRSSHPPQSSASSGSTPESASEVAHVRRRS